MILKNNELTVTIDNLGAEAKSIIKNNVEYLWQADPLYWKRSSPVLFPIVGRLLDDEYIYNQKKYHMTQHGFARDNEFILISYSETKVLYLLKENASTLKNYPFKFNLYIEYELIENQLIVTWTVQNTNSYDMYFQIGAHPAFNFLNGSIVEVNKQTNLYELKGTPNINNIKKNIKVTVIPIDDTSFLNDAIIYDNIDEITLKDNKKSITLKTKDFPYLGIWTKVIEGKNSPFICLEPWYGISDFMDHDKQLIHKIGIHKLKVNEIFKTSYTIVIN
ncbi:aldose 1-epimerase family protein [Mariniplasma anaerobium]|uniref:LACX protein n=1 Tax=Mariniplasma anaerobium TaxID=2735436 RepID=A0A7U9XWE5_9MOLU|nr:aldose 1-epimerase family protein [Mariniplasma anaerobium]BCR36192.1 LACX protein [Mariniplasma anaerobium]